MIRKLKPAIAFVLKSVGFTVGYFFKVRTIYWLETGRVMGRPELFFGIVHSCRVCKRAGSRRSCDL